MLVDEPFVGLDEPGKQALLALFDAAAERGATLIVATHELTFVNRVDRLLALRDGQLVYDGPPAETDVHAGAAQLITRRLGYARPRTLTHGGNVLRHAAGIHHRQRLLVRRRRPGHQAHREVGRGLGGRRHRQHRHASSLRS